MKTFSQLFSRKLPVDKFAHSENINDFFRAPFLKPAVAASFYKTSFIGGGFDVSFHTDLTFFRPSELCQKPNTGEVPLANVLFSVEFLKDAVWPDSLKRLLSSTEVREVPGFSLAVEGEALLGVEGLGPRIRAAPSEFASNSDFISRRSSANFDVLGAYNTASLLMHELPNFPQISDVEEATPPMPSAGDLLNDLETPLLWRPPRAPSCARHWPAKACNSR